MVQRPSILTRLWVAAVWLSVAFFVLNLVGLIATVVLDSFATRWLGTWLPVGLTTRWYGSAWDEFQLDDVLITAFEAVFLVVAISGALGVPAAYALARREFPFIEQIDPRTEQAARVFGATTPKLFGYVLLPLLLPLLLPGVMAALLLVLVRTIAMFELAFLTAGPTSQMLVVALYYAVFAAGVRAVQAIDAMAVVYMATTLVWLLLALRFVNPTQIVGRPNGPSGPMLTGFSARQLNWPTKSTSQSRCRANGAG